jgi:nucleotide-binding universal stress UspA family protein
MFERILVAYNGSEGAKRALVKAGEIAKVAEAEIHVLTVGGFRSMRKRCAKQWTRRRGGRRHSIQKSPKK